jgi:mono/diheme cytochrome c family protein
MHRLIILLALFSIAGPAAAQDVGDPATGRELATQWCSECHDVGPSGRGARGRAPAFAEVARMSSATALSLSVFMRSSHPSMPNIMLSPAQSDDVVAYILSLRSAR